MLESVPNIESKTLELEGALKITSHFTTPSRDLPKVVYTRTGSRIDPFSKILKRIQKIQYLVSPKLVSLYIYLDTISCMQNF